MSMIKPRWRKIMADLWENKARTLLVVLSITIGVFAVGMVAGAYLIISQDLNISYAQANPANIQVRTDSFDEDYVNVAGRWRGIAQAEARREVSVRVLTAAGQWDKLSLIAIPDYKKSQINQMVAVSGRTVPRRREVVLEKKTLEALGVQLGDVLEIELRDGSKQVLEVVGVVMDPALGYGAFMGERSGYIARQTLSWVHEPELYNQLYLTAAENVDDRAHLKALADSVHEALKRDGMPVYRFSIAQTNFHPLSSIVNALVGILLLLGILVVFLSGSLIANTLQALMGQQLRQIGVMKLVGARRRQVVQLYLSLIFTFSILSLVIAIPAGAWAAVATARLAADLLNATLQPHTLKPLAVIIQAVVAVAVPLLAGISPVLKGARVSVKEAMSGAVASTGKKRPHLIDRLLVNLQGLSRVLLVSLRNTFRRKGRLALTLFNLMLGGAIFISVFNVRATLNQKIEDMSKYFKADVNLNFNQPYRIRQVRNIASRIEGVEHVEGWVISNGDLIDSDGVVEGSVTLFAPPENTRLLEPVLLAGRWLQPGEENGIAVNDAFWKDHPHLAPGDTLRLKIAGQEREWVVVGILQYTGMDDLFAYVSYNRLSRLLNMEGGATSFRLVTRESSTAFQLQVAQEVDRVFRDLGYQVSKVEAGNTLNESINGYINILVIFLQLLAVLTALVGGIGLAGTLSMNVMERTREIGVLRAIGAHNRIVIQLVLVEGLVICLLSFLMSVMVSFPVTAVLANVVSLAIFNAHAKFTLTPLGFLIWFGLALLLALGSSILPARNASKMTIREVLAYE